MRAITLHQPWASLIAEGVKTIDTRGRRSPWHTAIGETIAIHAGARKPDAMSLGEWHCDPRYSIEKYVPAEPRIWRSTTAAGDLFASHESRQLPLGAVLATCTLTDVVPIVSSRREPEEPTLRAPFVASYAHNDALVLLPRETPKPPAPCWQEITDQRPFGDFAPGRYALLLDNVVKLPEPIPVRGYQGLWRLPTAVAVLAGDQAP